MPWRSVFYFYCENTLVACVSVLRKMTEHFNFEPNPFQERDVQIMQDAPGLIKFVMLVELMYVYVILDSLMTAVELVRQIVLQVCRTTF